MSKVAELLKIVSSIFESGMSWPQDKEYVNLESELKNLNFKDNPKNIALEIWDELVSRRAWGGSMFDWDELLSDLEEFLKQKTPKYQAIMDEFNSQFGDEIGEIQDNQREVEDEQDLDDEDESYDNLEFDERLVLEPVGITDDIFKLKINGAEYGYKPDPSVFKGDINQLEKEFLYKLGQPGQALAWLKKNTILASRPGGHAVAAQPAMGSKVTDTIEIPSSSGSGTYTCSKYDDGNWTCTCPHHKHRGAECKHIKQAQDQLNKGVAPSKIAASATGEQYDPSLARYQNEIENIFRLPDGSDKIARVIKLKKSIPPHILPKLDFKGLDKQRGS